MKNHDTAMFSLKQILDSISLEKDFVRLNPILFGKILKGIPPKGKTTLTHSEITLYRISLKYALNHWSREGHRDWIAVEIPALQFTIKFIRKGSEEEKRHRMEGSVIGK